MASSVAVGPTVRYEHLSLAVALALCLLAAWHLHQIFAPGLFSYDSIDQYDQAVTQRYNSNHPPIMALSIAAARALGGDLQHLTLLQCAAAMVGVFFLAYESFCLIAGERRPALLGPVAGLAVLGLLLTRWSPLMVYAMTFWKDVWLLVCFCWIGALALNIFRTWDGVPSAAFWGKVAAYLLVVTLALNVRHNSIVVAPVCGGLLVMMLRPVLRVRYLVVAAVLPWAAAWSAQAVIMRSFHVQPTQMETSVLTNELLSLCVRNPDALDALPHLRQYLVPDWRDKVVPGWWDFSWGAVRRDCFRDRDGLRQDYRCAMLTFPRQLLAVKAGGFAWHLTDRGGTFCSYIYGAPMRGNQYTFEFDPQYRATRDYVFCKMLKLFHQPRQWLFARHLPWLVINAVLLIGLAGGWWFGRSARCGRAFWVAAIPGAYYFSYFIFSMSGEFRYMYPATLVVQVACLALLMGVAFRAVRPGMGRLYGWATQLSILRRTPRLTVVGQR